jgi:hypothetical protein
MPERNLKQGCQEAPLPRFAQQNRCLNELTYDILGRLVSKFGPSR